jgi:RNA polymerase sigma-70 factor (ECF subfamily)
MLLFSSIFVELKIYCSLALERCGLAVPYKNLKEFTRVGVKALKEHDMATDLPTSIRTRPELLNRLKTGEVEGWNEFYRTYGKVVRNFAIKAGLDDAQADEVVQDTAIAVARHLPSYEYDPKICRFKTWLLNQTSWRIKDQIRKRNREKNRAGGLSAGEGTTLTNPISRVADPAANLDALFEAEWRKNLFAAALRNLRHKFNPKQFQIFDLVAVQEWPAADVARSLGVTVANVYVTRHRVAAAVKKEVKHLEKKIEEAPAEVPLAEDRTG